MHKGARRILTAGRIVGPQPAPDETTVHRRPRRSASSARNTPTVCACPMPSSTVPRCCAWPGYPCTARPTAATDSPRRTWPRPSLRCRPEPKGSFTRPARAKGAGRVPITQTVDVAERHRLVLRTRRRAVGERGRARGRPRESRGVLQRRRDRRRPRPRRRPARTGARRVHRMRATPASGELSHTGRAGTGSERRQPLRDGPARTPGRHRDRKGARQAARRRPHGRCRWGWVISQA